VGKGKPVALGSKTFATRQQALEFFKGMLSQYSPEDVVSDADAEHLRELLQRHPDAAKKIGPGIHHFEVMSADYGTKCFGVMRTNGTRIDFSYGACINTDPGRR
jgi:Protein of unknown function (DUF3223)